MKARLLASLTMSALAVVSFPRMSIIAISKMYEKPRGKKRVERKVEWKQNLRSTNQRQKGLRSPIGRGK